MNNRIKAWLNLIKVKKLGYVKASMLIEQLGEPEYYTAEILKPITYINEIQKQAILAGKEIENTAMLSDLLASLQIGFVTIIDKEYPELLRHIYNPPLFLFTRGNLPIADTSKNFAVVGTRSPSPTGLLNCREITGELARAGFTIVSGLAGGIDSAAHKSAVENNSPTIAVLGTGVEKIYPHFNQKLAMSIMENGVLISEFIPGTLPDRWNFPARNRIISGLSKGVLVVEGAVNSGSLITAKFALDQNRDVYAIPGDIRRPQAKGPNFLIQKGAKLVSSAEDILGEYNLPEQLELFPKLEPNEQEVYDILKNNELDFDDLMQTTGKPLPALSYIITMLEMKGVVKRLPGNKITIA